MKKAFRIFASFTMLAVYLAMTVNVAVVAFVCRCPNHHTAAIHAHCTHLDSAHADCKCPIDGFSFTSACTCNHNHSATADQYIQPRTSDDDNCVRHTVQLLSAALLPSDLRPVPPAVSHRAYDECRIALTCGIFARVTSLRAPPSSI